MNFDSITCSVEDIIKNEFCIGCGLCAGICPKQCLQMTITEEAFPKPEYNSENCIQCRLCIQVCPFLNHEEDENTIGKKLYTNIEGIKHHSILGYYFNTYTGYISDEEKRLNSASGGLASFLLSSLLKEGKVDKVACVVPSYNDKSTRFVFKLFSDSLDVYKGAGSKYYPVEFSNIISEILSSNEKVAIIAVPCFAKGLRLAMKNNKKLDSRIKYIFGLMCARVKSRYFPDYLTRLKGDDENNISEYKFRAKVEDVKSYEFQFQALNVNKEIVARAPFNKEFSHNFALGKFSCMSCRCCDDIYAELTDITFMDGWLPEFDHEWRGTSIVITRTPEMDLLLNENIKSGHINAKTFPPEKVVNSQKSAIKLKRERLAHQLWFWDREKRKYPTKRIKSLQPPNLIENLWIRYFDYWRKVSFKAWKYQIKNKKTGLRKFYSIVFLHSFKLASLKALLAIARRLNK